MDATVSPAEIQNAREYLAELDAMQKEALRDGKRLVHIHLGFMRVTAHERLKNLESAAYRAALPADHGEKLRGER